MPAMDLIQYPPSPPDSLSSSPPPSFKTKTNTCCISVKPIISTKKAKPTKPDNQTPQLPLELWTRIISYITDSRYLPRTWLHFRLVSHVFKSATEYAFLDVHLRHTSLVFKEWDNLGVKTDKEGGKVLWPKVTLRYKGLEPGSGGERAVFERDVTEDEEMRGITLVTSSSSSGEESGEEGVGEEERMEEKEKEKETNLFDYSMRRWKEMLKSSSPSSSSSSTQSPPPHVLLVRHIVNDTPLPGLKVDFPTSSHPGQISLLWKPMLSSLFGEEEYVKWAQKVSNQHSPLRAKMAELMELVREGEIPFEEVLACVARLSRTTGDKVLGEVRRMRRGQQQGQRKGMEGERGGKEDSLKAELVQRMKEQVGWVVFDDEEGEEENANKWRGGKDREEEENEGNFYDGLGMRFKGNGELNGPPSSTSSSSSPSSDDEGECWSSSSEVSSYDDEEEEYEGWDV